MRHALLQTIQKKRDTLTWNTFYVTKRCLKPSLDAKLMGITHRESSIRISNYTEFTVQHLSRAEEIGHGQDQWKSTMSDQTNRHIDNYGDKETDRQQGKLRRLFVYGWFRFPLH